jgi:hypothetical protein
MSMAAADAAMLDAIREDILHPDVVREAVAEALSVLTTPTLPSDEATVTEELTRLAGELQRLTEGLAVGGER